MSGRLVQSPDGVFWEGAAGFPTVANSVRIRLHPHPRLAQLLSQAADDGLFGDFLSSFFSAGLKVETAFGELSAAERDELFAHIPALLERFGKTRYLAEGDSLETETHINALRQAKTSR